MNPTNNSKEGYINEIIASEKAFCKLAEKEGLKQAFLTYADPTAALNRNDSIIKGKLEIGKYFDNQSLLDVKLIWEPDFVDVSKSGDLGYTYGKYTFEAKDSSGQDIKSNGIFHTVWKKQEDGKWLFVWD